MKKIYAEPVSELVVMKFEAPLCESNDFPLSDLDAFGDALEFIW